MLADLHYEPPRQPAIILLEKGGTLIHVSHNDVKKLRLRPDVQEWLVTQNYGCFYPDIHKAYTFRDIPALRAMFSVPDNAPEPQAIPGDKRSLHGSVEMDLWQWSHFRIHQDSDRLEKLLPIGRYV